METRTRGFEMIGKRKGDSGVFASVKRLGQNVGGGGEAKSNGYGWGGVGGLTERGKENEGHLNEKDLGFGGFRGLIMLGP